MLRRYRQEQERWYRAHGRIPSGYAFTALDGGPLSPDYLTATFTQLVKASGLPPVRLHDLRRGAASLARAGGAFGGSRDGRRTGPPGSCGRRSATSRPGDSARVQCWRVELAGGGPRIDARRGPVGAVV